jgi:hypothetical protein
MPDVQRQRVPSGGQAGGYGGYVEGSSDDMTKRSDERQPYEKKSGSLDSGWINVAEEDKLDQGEGMMKRGWRGGREEVPTDDGPGGRPGGDHTQA